MDLFGGPAQRLHIAVGQHRHGLGDQLAAVGAGEQGAFGLGIGIAQRETQQEAVQLRIRQREGARQVHRVLGGDDEERIGQRMGGSVQGYLLLGHRFQQCALGARRCAVDLVGQQHLGEHRAGVEAELARAGLVHRHAQHVGRQQVGGELDALEAQADGRGQCVRQGGLAQPGQVLDQGVATGQQRDQGQPHFLRFAQHQGVDLLLRPVQGLAQRLG